MADRAEPDVGDAEFERFFRTEQPKMVALAAVLTGIPEVGRDIAQDALLEAFRAWPTVSRLESPGGWLRRVTINRAVSWHRSATRAQRMQHRLVDAVPAEPAQVEGRRFWDAVRALPDRQREVVALHYLEDRAVADIARVLDIAEGTVKSSLHTARATLATALGVNHEEQR